VIVDVIVGRVGDPVLDVRCEVVVLDVLRPADIPAPVGPVVKIGIVPCRGAPRARHPRGPAGPDGLLHAHLAAQVAEVADQSEVDEAVHPPQRGQHEYPGQRGHHRRDQQRDHHPLTERVPGPCGERRGLGVESAPPAAEARGGSLPAVLLPARARLVAWDVPAAVLAVGVVAGGGVALLRVTGPVDVRVPGLVGVGRGVVGVLVRGARLRHPTRRGRPDRRPRRGVELVPLVVRVHRHLQASMPHRSRQHPAGEGGLARPLHLLASPRDRRDEDQQPQHHETREDQRAGHGCLLPERPRIGSVRTRPRPDTGAKITPGLPR